MPFSPSHQNKLRNKLRNKFLLCCAATIIGSTGLFTIATISAIKPVTTSLRDINSDVQTVRLTDRTGQPLDISYKNQWNHFDFVPLYEIPEFMKTCFILSEDKNFYTHHGVDWGARFSALRQNISAWHRVRGASTITEQVVRMINPRPRTLWSRWIEGFEAAQLESKVSKADILEFYLNQVPYAANRRGVIQAARYYFNRDLTTLTQKEMIALTILVRAPGAYDLYKNPDRMNAAILRLATTLKENGVLDQNDLTSIISEKLSLTPASPLIEARHFARYVRTHAPAGINEQYVTTLDSSLQKRTQSILDARLASLRKKHVYNAAALVADYKTGEILAWVVAGAAKDKDQPSPTPSVEIDTVTTPRQPGSSMKPFLYALALDKGWTAATILDDSPLAEAIGSGLHNFRNYSNTYYGPISVREALGNSLNIPALRTIRAVGVGDYMTALKQMHFDSLSESSEIYEEGLALGNGAVTLLEMVEGYATLANHGIYKPLHFLLYQQDRSKQTRIYSDESASLIGNILSDPWARRLEFGAGSVLNFPVQTAVKTGTSTDYRDAWTLGYNDRYVVGIWMGNLDNTPMNEITGSYGPALALRSIFSLLNEGRETSPLYLSPRLTKHDICIHTGDNHVGDNHVGDNPQTCPLKTEWFTPETVPQSPQIVPAAKHQNIELVRPTDGLKIAYDPRIPKESQKFRFELTGVKTGQIITWSLDDQPPISSTSPTLLWPIERGQHTLKVDIKADIKTDVGGQEKSHSLPPVKFMVK